LEVAADRGSLFPCPVCGKPSKAHDFAEFTWRHLNFFQHHCYITAKIPRTDCDEYGVLRMTPPWGREGSRFTLLFEQAALMLVREMPLVAAARIIEITDKRLWRDVEHYVGRAVERLDLSNLAAVGLDETAAKRGHTYVTVFRLRHRVQGPAATLGRGGTFAWLNRCRRLAKDFENLNRNALEFIQLAPIRLMLRKLSNSK
jgi:transposase